MTSIPLSNEVRVLSAGTRLHDAGLAQGAPETISRRLAVKEEVRRPEITRRREARTFLCFQFLFRALPCPKAGQPERRSMVEIQR